MKIGQKFIGKEVRISWLDPTVGERRMAIAEAEKGKEALGRWVEWGRIDDITDGVIRLRHAEATDVSNPKHVDEAFFSYIIEELVESIEIAEYGNVLPESTNRT